MRKLRLGARTEEDSDHGICYVFGESYRNQEQVEAKLIKLGRLLQQQPDPRRPTTAFSTYIIEPDPKNRKQNQNREKAGT